jgi:hypothetical protein
MAISWFKMLLYIFKAGLKAIGYASKKIIAMKQCKILPKIV